MSTEAHLSGIDLDRLALDAVLEPPRAEALRQHLTGCAACREALEARRSRQSRFAADVLPRTAAPLHRRVVHRQRMRVTAMVLPVAAAASLLLVLGPTMRTTKGGRPAIVEPSAEPSTKGGPSMKVVARHDDRVFTVRDGVSLVPGDQIRFVVEPGGFPYLLIASIDGAGQATVYFPFGGTASARVPDGARFEVPGSIVLDRARGPERLYALFSRSPLPTAAVTGRLQQVGRDGPAAIRAQSQLEAAAEAQVSVLFEKVVP